MWFHISSDDLGASFLFTPRIPDSAVVSKEGNIPRICVCSDIHSCLMAITGVGKVGIPLRDLVFEFKKKLLVVSPAIYVCKDEPYLPPDVSDFRLTKEHWYLQEKMFNRQSFLSIKSLLSGEIKEITEPETMDFQEYRDLISYEMVITNNKP